VSAEPDKDDAIDSINRWIAATVPHGIAAAVGRIEPSAPFNDAERSSIARLAERRRNEFATGRQLVREALAASTADRSACHRIAGPLTCAPPAEYFSNDPAKGLPEAALMPDNEPGSNPGAARPATRRIRFDEHNGRSNTYTTDCFGSRVEQMPRVWCHSDLRLSVHVPDLPGGGRERPLRSLLPFIRTGPIRTPRA
jgi:hypothetical protein